MKQTQCEAILKHLLAGNTLTGLQALELFSTMKCASRVSELKRQGHDIRSDMIELPNGKRVARYWMLPAEQKRAA